MGLEGSLLILVPFSSSSKDSLSNEATTKYFIIQVLSALLFLVSTTGCVVKIELGFTLSLLLKLGAFPFFMWVPQAYSGFS